MSSGKLGMTLRCSQAGSAAGGARYGRRANRPLTSLCVSGLALVFALIDAAPGYGEQASSTGAAEMIEFGANTSDGARDGVCSDLRFDNNPSSARPGMAPDPVSDDIFRDASDCYLAYVGHTIHLRKNVDGINFGSDQGPRDYKCQDPRFAPLRSTGERPSATKSAHEGTDASDCWLAYISEDVGKYDTMHHVVFGNDWGQWPNDGQCDDPRFRNVPGVRELLMAEFNNTQNVGRDATDCRNAMAVKAIELRPNDDIEGLHFGNDLSLWAYDYECDDGRFEAIYSPQHNADITMSTVPSNNSVEKDATDCRGAYEQKRIVLTAVAELDDISFGQNTSDYAYNGTCDDPRFEDVPGKEPRMASYLSDLDWGADAVDCYRAYRDGNILLRSRSTKSREF